MFIYHCILALFIEAAKAMLPILPHGQQVPHQQLPPLHQNPVYPISHLPEHQ
jgi:hypothetical protein